MDDAELEAMMRETMADPEQQRRGAETQKLALSLAKMTDSYADAFAGDDYGYMSIVVLVRYAIEQGDQFRPEMTECVVPPQCPAEFASLVLRMTGENLTPGNGKAVHDEN
jgi:hypothetical protein